MWHFSVSLMRKTNSCLMLRTGGFFFTEFEKLPTRNMEYTFVGVNEKFNGVEFAISWRKFHFFPLSSSMTKLELAFLLGIFVAWSVLHVNFEQHQNVVQFASRYPHLRFFSRKENDWNLELTKPYYPLRISKAIRKHQNEYDLIILSAPSKI